MAARASGPLDMVDGTRGVKFAGFPLAGFAGGGWRADGSCRWLPSKASNRYSLPLRSTPLSFGCGSGDGAALSGYLLDMLRVHIVLHSFAPLGRVSAGPLAQFNYDIADIFEVMAEFRKSRVALASKISRFPRMRRISYRFLTFL